MRSNNSSPAEKENVSGDKEGTDGELPRREYLQYAGALAGMSLMANEATQSAMADSHSGSGSDTLQAIHPTLEYSQNPDNVPPTMGETGSLGESPRFSWKITGPKGTDQSAYRVIVAESQEDLDSGDDVLWDSEKVVSSESAGIIYDGKPLEPDTTYHWKIRFWDQDDEAGAWSEPAQFTTAIPDTDEAWTGAWIGEDGGDQLSPLLRTDISIEKSVSTARAHVVTLGYGELYINGDRIGDEQLNPATTEFDERILYSTHDVEDVLDEGDNALGIWLGKGWYAFDDQGTWGGLDGIPKSLLQLNVTYDDGTTDSFVTNPSWTMDQSPITEHDIYDGERYDARLEQSGWSMSGFDDSDWESVDEVSAPAEEFELQPQRLPPIEKTETIEPDAIVEREDGFMVDFGQNHPGWVELTIAGATRGDEITMEHAEVLLTEDMELTRDLETGSLNKVDLRSAEATDVYVASSDDEETYEPRFTYHGYRYVRVSGYPGELTAEDIQAHAVHTGHEQNGSFSCSNEDLNQVQDNATWALRSNAMGHPTDCAQRDERLGWTGDVSMNVHSDFFNFGTAARFHEKWSRDHNDFQAAYDSGFVGAVVPSNGNFASPIEPTWSRTRVIVPWRSYLHTGDETILEENYDGMRDYVDYWYQNAEDGILSGEEFWIGDWLALEGRYAVDDDPRSVLGDASLFGTYALYQVTDLFAKAADALGREEDAQSYRERADAVAEAYHEEFFDPETDSYGTGTQTTYALSLDAGIVPEEHADAVADSLAQKVQSEDDGKLQTGFIGTRPLIYALADYGYEELAYEVVSQPEYPGWVYMVRQGATTMWEWWGSDEQIGNEVNMNSFNHRPWSLVSEWFYQQLAGIDIGEPGYAEVEISPQIVDDLEWVEAETETVRGTVSSSWKSTEDGVMLDVTVPGNATGNIEIPTLGADEVRVREGGKTIWNNGNRTRPNHAGITKIDRERDRVKVNVVSGEYTFELC